MKAIVHCNIMGSKIILSLKKIVGNFGKNYLATLRLGPQILINEGI